MFATLVLPLLLTASALCPRPSFAVLLPPEGNDYPLYDFPSLQYLPHNSLAEYQDPRSLSEEDKMEISTRSTYFPLPPSSEPSPPSSSSSSSSSSSLTMPCTVEDLATLLNLEGLDKIIKVVSKIEGKSTKDLLLKLALRNGLHLKDRDSVHTKNPSRDYKAGGPLTMGPSGNLKKMRFMAQSPLLGPTHRQMPLVHLRRPPVALSPPQGLGEGRILEGEPVFETAAVEVPAIAPRGVSMPPQAVLVVLDDAREEVARTAVDLGPRMALLDVLKEAKSVYALNNGPYRHNPFSFKAKRLESERCLGLQTMGRVAASPSSALSISVTRTRPLTQVIWDSACLPRVADLLVHRDDIIVLAPR